MSEDKESIFRSVIRDLRESNQTQIDKLFNYQLKMNEIYVLSYKIEGNDELKSKILRLSSPV